MEPAKTPVTRKPALKSAMTSSSGKHNKHVTFLNTLDTTSDSTAAQVVYPKKISQRLHSMVRWSNGKLGMARKNAGRQKNLLLKMMGLNQRYYEQCHARNNLEEAIKKKGLSQSTLAHLDQAAKEKRAYDELVKRATNPKSAKKVKFADVESVVIVDGGRQADDYKPDVTAEDFNSSGEEGEVNVVE